MDDYIYEWHHEGEVTTFRWLGEQPVTLDRVYALAFTESGKMLLVGDDTGTFWLPGGGIEAGESPSEALGRELVEEAAATVLTIHYLGAQRADAPPLTPEFYGYFWCRIQLAEDYVPELEVTKRLLVPPEQFLDTLFWGRDDPTAALLFEKALTYNAQA